jgi:hypothetical protein
MPKCPGQLEYSQQVAQLWHEGPNPCPGRGIRPSAQSQPQKPQVVWEWKPCLPLKESSCPLKATTQLTESQGFLPEVSRLEPLSECPLIIPKPMSRMSKMNCLVYTTLCFVRLRGFVLMKIWHCKFEQTFEYF